MHLFGILKIKLLYEKARHRKLHNNFCVLLLLNGTGPWRADTKFMALELMFKCLFVYCVCVCLFVCLCGRSQLFDSAKAPKRTTRKLDLLI